jgi:hypothetical protein
MFYFINRDFAFIYGVFPGIGRPPGSAWPGALSGKGEAHLSTLSSLFAREQAIAACHPQTFDVDTDPRRTVS